MTTKRTPAQIGRANRRAGKDWQLACSAWLREHGFPNAAYEIRNGQSDIIGTWDVATECTLADWSKAWIKLAQAEADAGRRGLDLWCVWKKRQRNQGDRGAADPGQGMIMMPAHLFWPLMADLEAYQRAEMDFTSAWERGYRAGAESSADSAKRQR